MKDHSFSSFAWPYGRNSDKLSDNVKEGSYKGIHYKNDSVVLIRDTPAPSPITSGFNPYALPRIRATGFKTCNYDLIWWLEHIDINEMYVSDGDPDTITVLKAEYEKNGINEAKLPGKTLELY